MSQLPPVADSEVRRRLGAPSMECMLIKARLQHLGMVCRERHNFPTVWAILDMSCGSAHKGAEADVSCHSRFNSSVPTRKRRGLSPKARQSRPYPEELGCENSWLSAAENERKWRAPVGSLHFVESTFDKKSLVSRATES